MTTTVMLRNEWLKMAYPGEAEAIVVCEVMQVNGVWVAFHSTKPTQRSDRFSSPGGIDVGTIKYLDSLGVVKRFNLHYKGYGKIYKVDFDLLKGAMVGGAWTHGVLTRKKQFRKRVFLPDDHWTVLKPVEPYAPPVKIPVRDETRISSSGDVMWRTNA